MNLDRLRELSSIAAASGYEDPMIRVVRRELTAAGAEVQVDRLGNVIGRLPGADPDAPAVMVFAHMDELGFIVRKIEPDGFLRLERLGGIPERVAPARPMIVTGAAGPVLGVIGTKAHHYTPPEEKYTVVPAPKLYLDLGVRSAAEVEALGVAVGNPVTYAPFFHVQGDTVMAKSLDNRGGVAVLLEAAHALAGRPRARDVYCVATVQEEFTLRGVLPAVDVVRPEIAIALDIVVACDTPDLRSHADIALGGGPVVSFYTFHGRGTLGGLIPNPKLAQRVITTATNHTIPVQRNVSMGLLTDASFLAVAGEGVHCLDLGFACRYTHSPVEVASLSDLDALVNLLVLFLSELPPALDLSRG